MSMIVKAEHLSKKYGKHVALNDVSFEIPAGRIVGLIGPNGAGKTTALKAILGLTRFDGNLKILGNDPMADRGKLMQDVCFIADVAVLPRWIRVREVIEYVQAVHPRFSREKLDYYLSSSKIKPASKVKTLSKGMVAQLHLAIVMAIDAKLLVLDEPTLGLDILFRKKFYANLLNDYFDEERTIIITTHQVEEIEHILTDLMFIRDGEIILDATMDDVAQRFCEVMVAPEKFEQARALGPLHERDVFGKLVCLYDNADPAVVSTLGEVRHPSVADLFVATMTEEGE